MNDLKRTFAILLAFVATGTYALSAPSKNYDLSATEAFELVQDNGEQILFLDVRDPVEIQFIGFTNEVDANIPFLFADPDSMTEEGKIPMGMNPHFIDDVKAALKAKDLDQRTTIITMCRSGSARGKPSAEMLRKNGFPNTYYVLHGFQGDKVEEGLLAGFRLKNGWQNSGLPWGWEVDAAKAYRKSGTQY